MKKANVGDFIYRRKELFERLTVDTLAPPTIGYRVREVSLYARWAVSNAIEAFPATPFALCAYLLEAAPTRGVANLATFLTAMHKLHLDLGLKSPARTPAVTDLMASLRRQQRRQQLRILTAEEVLSLVTGCEDGRSGARDRALILLAYASGLRASEIRVLQWEQLSFTDGLLDILTDRAGASTIRVQPGSSPETCPITALEQWRPYTDGIGYVFPSFFSYCERQLVPMGPTSFIKIIKRRCRMVGIPAKDVGFGSLRTGAMHELALNEVGRSVIMRYAGYRYDRSIPKEIEDIIVARKGQRLDRSAFSRYRRREE